MDLKNKSLKKEEIYNIYNTYMKYDFPENELKPLSQIISLYEKKIYYPQFFYTDDKPWDMKSYMFFTSSNKGTDFGLLDFFAVNKNYRNKGIGTKTIEYIKKTSPIFKNGFLAEIEDPDYAKTEEEKIIRQKRQNFYLKNGFYETDITSICFDVNFRIIYLPYNNEIFSNDILKTELDLIYKSIFPEKYYKDFVINIK